MPKDLRPVAMGDAFEGDEVARVLGQVGVGVEIVEGEVDGGVGFGFEAEFVVVVGAGGKECGEAFDADDIAAEAEAGKIVGERAVFVLGVSPEFFSSLPIGVGEFEINGECGGGEGGFGGGGEG